MKVRVSKYVCKYIHRHSFFNSVIVRLSVLIPIYICSIMFVIVEVV